MCVIYTLYKLFFRNENAPYNLSQARTFLADIEVVLGQLAITNWREVVFDYLPNLMYIGGFEGNSSLGDFSYALFIADNGPHLRQIHFPRLVEVPVGNITLISSPNLCYIGNLEFYLKSSDQTVRYIDPIDLTVISHKPYNECGMYMCLNMLLCIYAVCRCMLLCVCMCVCVCYCAYVFVYVCMHTCVYVYIWYSAPSYVQYYVL